MSSSWSKNIQCNYRYIFLVGLLLFEYRIVLNIDISQKLKYAYEQEGGNTRYSKILEDKD